MHLFRISRRKRDKQRKQEKDLGKSKDPLQFLGCRVDYEFKRTKIKINTLQNNMKICFQFLNSPLKIFMLFSKIF